MDDMHVCPGCGENKLRSEYPKNKTRSTGHGARCKTCHSSAVSARYAADPRRHQSYVLMSNFGITIDERDAMIERQDGVCAICGQPETSVWKGTLRTLAVDHDHDTGYIRGALCSSCNKALGMFKDSPELLRAAADYVEWASIEQAIEADPEFHAWVAAGAPGMG